MSAQTATGLDCRGGASGRFPERDGGAILDQCGNFFVSGYSPPNFLAFNPSAHYQSGGIPQTPETMYFNPPVSAVSMLVASNQPGVAGLRAYDSNNVLLVGQTLSASGAAQLMSVSANGIARVEFTLMTSYFIIDDLGFSYEAVPTAAGTWGRLKTLYR